MGKTLGARCGKMDGFFSSHPWDDDDDDDMMMIVIFSFFFGSRFGVIFVLEFVFSVWNPNFECITKSL